MKKILKSKKIVLKLFPTHIEKTDNKVAPNKYIKINNQAIYNGSLNRFARAIAVRNLHKYVIDNIPSGFKIKKFPVKPIYTFYVVKNHGDIRRTSKGVISWKKPKSDYKATWDDDNLAFLWMKTIRDALTQAGVWEDDNVEFVRGSDYDVKFVDDIKDRKIIINFVEV